MTKQKTRKPLLQLSVKHRDAHSRGSSIAEAEMEFAIERISNFLENVATQSHIPFEMLTARIQEQGAANLLNSLGYEEQASYLYEQIEHGVDLILDRQFNKMGMDAFAGLLSRFSEPISSLEDFQAQLLYIAIDFIYSKQESRGHNKENRILQLRSRGV